MQPNNPTTNPADRAPFAGGSDAQLVSVVIPTHNRRPVLEKCLHALRVQTYPRYEIVVVDDGSTDETVEFLEQFATAHPGLALQVVGNERSVGANVSRNRGIRRAQGTLVAFVDSDCIPAPNWLEKLVAGFSSPHVAAVTGLVEDPPPRNVYELAFRGTHRLQPGDAKRLVGGNMCIRRSLLLERPLDEDLRWGCDEEGISLWLHAKGCEQKVVPDAVVLHEHYYDRGAFFRQAYNGGGATARLVYKYHLPPRLDLLPFILTYAHLPLILLDLRLALVPAFFLMGAGAAILYNELSRKGKTFRELLKVYPVLVVYYHVRMVAYVLEAVRLRLRRNGITRQRLPKPG